MNNGIMQVFDKQRKRGTDGFGLWDGLKNNIIKARTEDQILKWLVKYDSPLVMFHHRLPTSTENIRRAAHPFSTKKYFGETQYVLIHNGVIRNSKELYEEHRKLGIEYQSLLENGKFNDSEALMWDMALFLEGKQKEPKAVGTIAFTCVMLVNGKRRKLFFGRNSGNPLNMYRKGDILGLSSEGAGEEIETNKLHTWNYALKRLTKRDVEFKRYEYTSSYNYGNSYPYANRQTYNGRSSNTNYDRHGNDDYWDGYLEHVLTAEEKRRREMSSIEDCLTGYCEPQYEKVEDDEYEDMTWDDQLEMYIPEGSSTDNLSDADVESAVMEYLIAAKGNFEQAYWMLEEVYDSTYDYATASELYKMEKAMEMIHTDPEYKDETSISSMWRSIWDDSEQKAQS